MGSLILSVGFLHCCTLLSICQLQITHPFDTLSTVIADKNQFGRNGATLHFYRTRAADRRRSALWTRCATSPNCGYAKCRHVIPFHSMPYRHFASAARVIFNFTFKNKKAPFKKIYISISFL